jgi:very-short-patch-repair endonuclease
MKSILSVIPWGWLVLGGLLLLAGAVLAIMAARPTRYRRRPLLTGNELEFYRRLRRALPQLQVLPQVAMAGLIEPDTRDARQHLDAFRRISQKRVDFAIARDDLSIVCVIELDDSTHDPDRDASRDAMMESAGICTLRYDSRRKPEPATIAADVGKAALVRASGGRR